jgi:Mg2+/Co2+ transporter CorC
MNEEQPPSTLSFLQRLKKRFFHIPLRSSDELLQSLKEAEESHVIDSHSRSIIEGTMQLENMEVRDVMVPRSKMILIDLTKIKLFCHHAFFYLVRHALYALALGRQLRVDRSQLYLLDAKPYPI